MLGAGLGGADSTYASSASGRGSFSGAVGLLPVSGDRGRILLSAPARSKVALYFFAVDKSMPLLMSIGLPVKRHSILSKGVLKILERFSFISPA